MATTTRTEYRYSGRGRFAHWREDSLTEDENGSWQVLPRRKDIAPYAGDFDHGDPSRGAELLAASLLAHATNVSTAKKLYRHFAVDVVARWRPDKTWGIRQQTIRAWVSAAKAARDG